MSKTAGETKTTSTTGPASFQQPFLQGLFNQAQSLYGGSQPTYYPGSTVANFAPAQEESFRATERAAPIASELAVDYGAPAMKQALTAYDVRNNPWVAGAASAATQPLYERLMTEVLPALRQGSVAQGMRGSSREALAAGQAVGQTQEAAGNVNASIYNNAYNTGMSSLLSGLSLMPTQQQSMFAPAQALLGVGNQQQAQEQAGIDEAVQRYMYNQGVPFEQLKDYASLISTPYGGASESTVTGTPPDSASQKIAIALGAAGVLPSVIKEIIGLFT